MEPRPEFVGPLLPEQQAEQWQPAPLILKQIDGRPSPESDIMHQQITGRGMHLSEFPEPPEIIQVDPVALKTFLQGLGIDYYTRAYGRADLAADINRTTEALNDVSNEMGPPPQIEGDN